MAAKRVPVTEPEVFVPAKPVSKRVRIVLRRPEGVSKSETARFVSVNSKSFLIQYGVPVEVPEYVADVIEEALKARDHADDYIRRLQEGEKA